MHIFSDLQTKNSQNKNKFLWAFYEQIIDCQLLEKIIIYYPNPGHSVIEIDGDFGRIEINKRNYEKVYFTSEYERIIRNTNVENPFEVISVNYPNRYDSAVNQNKITKVYNYKKKFSAILKN